MEFTKFPKMENLQTAMSANTEDFETAAKLPTKWAVTEKIDGTNISLNITKDDFQFGCRNGLTDGEFYNVGKEYGQVSYLVELLRNVISMNGDDQITLYGEFFGQKIMNRLHYGMDGRFRFYAALLYSKGHKDWFTMTQLMEVLDLAGLSEMFVPVLAIDLTFEEACAFKNDGKSFLCEDTMEGVVLWPEDVMPFWDGHVYAFKNKNDAFLETSARKVHTPLTEAQQYAQDMNGVFLEYLTESRMWSVFSKLGPAPDDKRAGEYIVALLNDAWDDFVQDNPDIELLDKPGIKKVRNGGSAPYTLFKTVQAKMAKGDHE